MRESNFAFPTQNKACVCITSQLYDRRALDTTSPLPLLNSLTHLTYLTSTSPRIREIMTMDGGLERLVRILRDFCMCPPPPENPAVLYGLSPPSTRPVKPVPTLNPHSFDKQAAYRFSLAFQCVVNIGVRGSEPIRSRVVQAGTLDVVGCILEAWLANKGFAVGPSSSATGMPRETREQRQARRDAHLQQRQAEMERQLHRRLQLEQRGTRSRPALRLPDPEEDENDMDVSPGESSGTLLLSASTPAASGSDTEMSTDASSTNTPVGSGTPTGSVIIPSRDRSGTIIARPVWDPAPTLPATGSTTARYRRRGASPPSDTSRAETETEDDGEGDVDMSIASSSNANLTADSDASPSPSPQPHRLSLARRAVGIVSDDPPAADGSTDAHIIINDAVGEGDVGVGGVGVEGVEDGIVSLEPNDDFAMGAPPGAPGAIAIDEGRRMERDITRRRGTLEGVTAAPDVTPRAGVVSLPVLGGGTATAASPAGRAQAHHHHHHHHQRAATIRGVRTTPAADVPGPSRRESVRERERERTDRDGEPPGPYRDEDVLLSLQLLAYLSKYPHVRQAFYKQRVTFHPASVDLPARAGGTCCTTKEREAGKAKEVPVLPVHTHGFFRAFGAGTRGKEKDRAPAPPSSSASTSTPPRQTNVFSLVERFTFKPSSTETDLPNPPPRLPEDIQYWAGVIMRNACRKDDSRGGIRQCANMLCGRWEAYPREFAKCRRCRKAKYCGKECQSTAWSEGHRFWCSAKDGDDDATAEQPPQSSSHSHSHAHTQHDGDQEERVGIAMAVDEERGGTIGRGGRTERRERERERERERHTRERTQGMLNTAASFARVGGGPTDAGIQRQHLRGPGVGGPSRVSPTAVAGSAFGGTPRPAAGARQHPSPIAPPRSRGNYVTAAFDAFAAEQGGGGRRRAETVTGVMGGGVGVGEVVIPPYIPTRMPPPPRFAAGNAPLLPHQHPHPHHALMQQQYVLPHQQQQYVVSPPVRPAEPGPSRRRRGDAGAGGVASFRMPSEESDMILG
ncbi:hypothetical protein Hypma_006140 [Hypsizygus marmoreus]|uniref:MYND-type domain-containing protein n=1 Tax=Hypsizygus marmoreus TaxID=39966 RepID=A0A369JYM9_HYPMA|nr:hypothetical protein Hypma_006140 [Hypsizygus marmoreus]